MTRARSFYDASPPCAKRPDSNGRVPLVKYLDEVAAPQLEAAQARAAADAREQGGGRRVAERRKQLERARAVDEVVRVVPTQDEPIDRNVIEIHRAGETSSAEAIVRA